MLRTSLAVTAAVASLAATLAFAARSERANAQAQAPAPVPAAAGSSAIDQNVFQLQVLLDRAGFAPGVIDGRKGMSFNQAVKGFQTARGLDATGELDDQTRAALLQDRAPVLVSLRIAESDAQGPFVGTIPHDPAAQAKMPCLCYRNLVEKLAEKFHTTPATIVALNDPRAPLRAGTVLRLPNVLPPSRSYGDVKPNVAQMLSDLNTPGGLPKADRIVVDKSDGVLRLFDKDDRLLAQFPATMGSSHDPLPLGGWKVTNISYNPHFHFQPELFWDVSDNVSEQRLPPGPNGPVGVTWIAISKPHYGIHGTAEPQTIQRAQSHGCVRLTNWDVAKVSQMVSNGMKVVFQA